MYAGVASYESSMKANPQEFSVLPESRGNEKRRYPGKISLYMLGDMKLPLMTVSRDQQPGMTALATC